MKKIIRSWAIAMLSAIILLPAIANSQTVYENTVDGQIWFKIKNDQPVHKTAKKGIGIVNNEDPYDIDLSQVPFLKGVKDKYGIENLSKPFHAAKNSNVLQRTYQLSFTNINKVDELVGFIEEQFSVEYAEMVPLNKTTFTPNDTYYNSSQQWGLFQIEADSAWDFSQGSSTIVVATVDNAIDINHTDLSANIWTNPGEIAGNGLDDDGNGYVDDVNGWDAGDNDNDPTPPSNTWRHGTHVAGITGAITNNGAGVASIGFGISMMAVKATKNSSGSNSVSNGYDGIVYAASSGAHVINCSWGGSFSSTTGQNVITWAYNQGSLVIAAAGNDDVNTKHYPAAYNNCIAVASTNGSDQKSSFSNYDDGTGWVDLAAPGTQIASTIPGNSYAYLSGTSMASPMASGLAGLMLSLNPSLPLSSLESCMKTTADPVQGTYSSLLGSGRINAKAAMNCVSSTLSNAPVADFTANYTTISAGGSVTFTDQSTFGPTSWTWDFDVNSGGGVTPSTYSGQSPPQVTYSTPGTYTVRLTVSNSNGSDVMTKTGYITVNAQASCDTLYYPIDADWNPTIYSSNNGGYVAGTNGYGDIATAEYFPSTTVGSFQYVTGTFIWVGRAGSPTASKTVDIKVWDGTGNTVGTVLATETILMDDIETDVSNNNLTYVEFSNPVAIPVSGEIYVGVDHSSLSYPTDSIGIVTSRDTAIVPDNAYEQWNDNSWNQMSTAWGFTGISCFIMPVLTDQPPVASITTNTTTICEGGSVSFDATGSTYQDTLVWTFSGGSPQNSSNVMENVTYNSSGTYRAYLQVIGGGCGAYAIDSIDITVNPSPNVSAATTKDTICPGGSADISASGNAASYTWDQGVANGTGPHTVSPTSTTTYTVTGTSSLGCNNSASVTVQVDVDPTAAYINNPSTNICPNQTVTFDATTSSSADNYNWSFTGGSPATSSLAVENVTYAASGTYNVELVVSNSCNQDTLTSSITIDVCTGIDDVGNEESVTSFFNSSSKNLELTLTDMPKGQYTVSVINSVGQHVVSEGIQLNSDFNRSLYNMNQFSDGVYHINVTNTKTGDRFVNKFVKM